MSEHDPPHDEEPTLPSSGPPSENKQIGPYRILELISEGGMGEVYLAEQREPVRRKVALKVVRAGLESREIVARFPRLIVPTYPGDEQWFASTAFETMVPDDWALERRRLDEIIKL